MKKFIQNAITNKAKKLLADHKPLVIAVAGSVGKTSARNAIASVLSAKFSVGTTIKNYNNEFGVPLTILGAESPGKSIFGWLKVLCSRPKAIPEIFVLEYGIDHPGDMQQLCDIVAPDIAVMTRISYVHAEHFRSMEELAEEKAIVLEHAKQLVVLNGDDTRVLGLEGHVHTPMLTYGFSSTAQIQASNYQLETREDFFFKPGDYFSTIRANVTTQDGDQIDLELQNMLGTHSVSALLPAIAIAKHLGLSREQILEKLSTTQFEPGRMNPMPGIKGSLIIDSSYNAAPASVIAALNVLEEFHPSESARRIAVLGHMAELGQYSEQEHHLIGLKVGEVGVDLLVTVGELARDIRRGAIEAGMPEEHTQHFDSPLDAGRWLDREIRKGDIVLVKGSQSARTEKIVKDVMAEPLRAPELLVRQSTYWTGS
ncbi:UDP-N-acetylmuramoyl-tripeptide--D-alanyl-D-alanine ligase [Patescibacteria group bacterium]|nr:MAG: UDP-N-acetylmuramoyl-tripeptide--D-alanyl-D-alanine ligase [Patescibacteria group bacterium]